MNILYTSDCGKFSIYQSKSGWYSILNNKMHSSEKTKIETLEKAVDYIDSRI